MHDTSYGIIPLQQVNGKWQVFIIRHLAGHWGFPKGHLEPDEIALQGAERECREETGLQVVRYLPDILFDEMYSFEHHGETIHKHVYYFPALVEGTPVLQLKEIMEGCWVDLEGLTQYFIYPEAKALSERVREYLELSYD